MANAFELADTLPAFAAVSEESPPSSGRYSWVDPARLQTTPAPDSRWEQEMAVEFSAAGRRVDGRPEGLVATALRPMRVPKF
jgi:hypothetical protein